jgi:hypothetical protein
MPTDSWSMPRRRTTTRRTTARRVDDLEQRLIASRQRAIEHLKNAMETERRVVRQNRDLADAPIGNDPEVARQRVREGEAALAEMERELADLERNPHVPLGSPDDVARKTD